MAEIVTWFNLPREVQELKDGLPQVAAATPTLAATTNIAAVPATFADEAAVRTYLAGATVIPNIESRLDAIESRINLIITNLRAAGVIQAP